ncbi:MAG TPA: hypothetical protein VIJ07_21055 [Dermatophilaceae bacterium]
MGQRGIKVAALVAGMVAGADSIDDMTCCAPAGWRRSSPQLGPCPVRSR